MEPNPSLSMVSPADRSSKCHCTGTPLTTRNNGTRWLIAIIKLIWTNYRNEWLNRNNVLHSNIQQTRNHAYLHQAEFRIRALKLIIRLSTGGFIVTTDVRTPVKHHIPLL
jgi:hypothetical protein